MRIRKDIDLPIRGKDVLLIEDIVDTGYTLRTILDLLRFRGARSVKLCALLDKAPAREVEVPIDYKGFAIETALRGRLRPRLRRALPQPPLHRRAGRRGFGRHRAVPLLERTGNDEIPRSDNAPKAIGPYCQAVEVDGWLYLSGQIGLDPTTGELVPGGFEAQARQVLENLRAGAGRGRLHLRRRGQDHRLPHRLRRLPQP